MSPLTFANEDKDTVYHLPDTLRDWPWARQLNPYYDDAKEESAKWIVGFNAFSPRAQRAFDRCDFCEHCDILACWFLISSLALLTSLAFPEASSRMRAIVQ